MTTRILKRGDVFSQDTEYKPDQASSHLVLFSRTHFVTTEPKSIKTIQFSGITHLLLNKNWT